MRRLILWIFLSLLICSLTLTTAGCSLRSRPLIRYNISQGVQNLDPQFAQQPNELLVVLNCFEGLFRLDEEGTVVPAAVERYLLSQDRCTYTFYLKKDLQWSDGIALTAHDFVFAFQRLFQTSSPAPNAQDLIGIRNASAVLEGSLPVSQLGVKALDDHTLQITLEQPDLFFTELLTTAAAMPCREDFFHGCNGRYGLSLSTLIFNGPYTVGSWNNDKYIGLFPNESYAASGSLPVCTVYLYTTRPQEENLSLLLEDRGDGGPVYYSDLSQLEGGDFSVYTFENTVYLLLFNQQIPQLQNQNIRLGMAYAFNRQLFQPYLENNLTLTNLILPPTTSIQGQPYRELVSVPGILYDSATAQRYFSDGLSELGISKLSKSTLICLDTGPHKMLSGFIQQQWQNDLNLYVNTEALSASDFYARIASGDFEMAIVPFTMSQSNPGVFLSQLLDYLPETSVQNPDQQNLENETEPLTPTSSIHQDLTKLQSDLSAARQAQTPKQAAQYFAQAESLLLEKGYVIPLYFESSYFAISSRFEDVIFTPFSGSIYFHQAWENNNSRSSLF